VEETPDTPTAVFDSPTIPAVVGANPVDAPDTPYTPVALLDSPDTPFDPELSPTTRRTMRVLTRIL